MTVAPTDPLALAACVCPVCRGEVSVEGEDVRCRSCGHIFPRHEGILTFLVDEDERAAEQAAFFDDAVDEEFEITRPHGTPRWHRWVLEEKFRRSVRPLPSLAGRTVLVVCAGSGMDAELLARRGASVVATDVSHGAARRITERAARFGVQLGVCVADVRRLPFADRSFDVVYVHDGLHHLERPLQGLREMARVARTAVSVSEPARAGLTRLAVRAGVALEREEAGNEVARLAPEDILSALADCGFRPLRVGRYAMYYRHEPGRPSRALSAPVLFPLARATFRAANALGGRFGNKLVVVATRR